MFPADSFYNKNTVLDMLLMVTLNIMVTYFCLLFYF